MRLVSLLAPLCLLQISLVVLDSSEWIIVERREGGHPGSVRGEHDCPWLGLALVQRQALALPSVSLMLDFATWKAYQKS